MIYITSRTNAGRLILSKSFGPKITHIVSFGTTEYEERAPAGFFKHPAHKIRFLFHDIDGDAFEIYTPPSRDDIEKLIEFYNAYILSHENPEVLIHCLAGVSRSSAAALILMRILWKEKTIQELYTNLKEIKSNVSPNKRMIMFADEILSLEGKFIQGLEEIRGY